MDRDSFDQQMIASGVAPKYIVLGRLKSGSALPAFMDEGTLAIVFAELEAEGSIVVENGAPFVRC